MKFSYETVGNSSYLAVTFVKGENLINYQLQMLINNDIKNIVKAGKRQKNDDVEVYYNITSKISLEQFTHNNKISKADVIKLIEGALDAMKDIEEYQLVSSGIVFDTDKIYIKPGSFEPTFIYIPASTEDSGIEPLKKLLVNLIISSKVEATKDDFVQVLLEALNNPALDIEELRKLCNSYKGNKVSEVRKADILQQETKTAFTPPTAIQQTIHQEVKTPPAAVLPVQEFKSDRIPPTQQQSIPKPQNKEKSQDVKPKENEKKPPKTLFIILQLVFAIILVGTVVSGVLNDESGKINLQYLAGVVLALGGADFVLYREMFVNKKGGKGKEKPKNNAKKSSVAVPGKTKPLGPDSIPNMPPKPVGVKPVSTNFTSPQPVKQAASQQTYVPPANTQSQYGAVSEFESEDTVVMTDNGSGAYLEYYENGLATRIKLDKDIVVVGKLRSQCDAVVNNNKISKMHAEFITRGVNYFVKDYNSTNGTYINGSEQRITSNTEYQIFNGDRITLANIDMTFRC